MALSPIVLFVYKRLRHTRETVDALRRNELSDQSLLFVYSDGPKTSGDIDAVNEVRSYLQRIDGFKQTHIIERDTNLGFSKSIIAGVTEVLRHYPHAIVVEDDITTARHFLKFMNAALIHFESQENIFSITGFSPPPTVMTFPKSYSDPVYLNPRCSSWGWATWKERWQSARWDISDYSDLLSDLGFQRNYSLPGTDRYELLRRQAAGQINSWDVLWDLAHHSHQAYCVYPRKSLVDNIGHDGSGVNCGNLKINYLRNDLSASADPVVFPSGLRPDYKVIRKYSRVFSNDYASKIWRFYKILTAHRLKPLR